MALAAYNAGAGRVAQWIAAYGDPRTAGVDPVDWVERIPFDETRDYVERVSENLAIYRARLSEPEAGQAPRVGAGVRNRVRADAALQARRHPVVEVGALSWRGEISKSIGAGANSLVRFGSAGSAPSG